MTPTDDLHQLIKSLDRTEKQRFKRFSKSSKEDTSQQYNLLFDDLNDCPVYEERAFLAAHEGRPYVSNYAFNKTYLYSLILDAVRGQRKRGGVDKPKEFFVRELLEDAHFLKEKMLFQQSFRRIQKARKEAQKYEFHEILLECLRMERTHLMERQEKGYEAQIRPVLNLIHKTGQAIAQKSELIQLRDLLFLESRRPPALKHSHEANAIASLMANPLLKGDGQDLPLEGQLNFHLIHALYHQLQGELPQAWDHHYTAYLLWKKETHFREARSTQFLKHLNNFLTLSNEIRKYAEFVEAIQLLEKGPFRSADDRAEGVQNGLFIRLQRYLTEANWEHALLVEDEFKRRRPEIAKKLIGSRLLAFYMSFARLHFILGNPKKVKQYCTYLLDEHHTGLRDLWAATTEVMLCIVIIEHYEVNLKEWEKLDQQLKAARTAVNKVDQSGYLHLTLEYLEAHAKADKVERVGLSQKYRRQMDAYAVEPISSEFVFFHHWATAKSEGVPLRDFLLLKNGPASA